MAQIATTIEQSVKLLDLGLSPESSDLYYLRIVGETYNQDTDMVLPITDNNSKVQLGFITEADYPAEDMLPAWSLGALLELMPSGINISAPKPLNVLSWCCWNQQEEFYANSPLEAAYDMVVWLLENDSKAMKFKED